MKPLNGLNTDVAHVDQPGGTYRRARNMVLDDLAGAMANEDAPSLLVDAESDLQDRLENMEICGQFTLPGDRTAIAVVAREVIGPNTGQSYEEAIYEITAEGSLNILASAAAGVYGFDATTPIQGVGYVNAAEQLILAWTDGVTKPKYINTSTDDAAYLIFPEAEFPMVRPVRDSAYDTSGRILGGTWTFMLAYEVVDGTNNITQYGPAIGSFRIGNTQSDELKTFNTSIGVKFYGLDTNYNYVRIYAVRTFNGIETVYYADRIRVNSTEATWSYIGQNESTENVPATDALFIPRANYITAATLTVSDDRLFMGNLSAASITEAEGIAVANSMNMKWTIDHTGDYAQSYDAVYADGVASGARNFTNAYWVDTIQNRSHDHTDAASAPQTLTRRPIYTDSHGLLGGFMPDEVYAFYVAFLMKDGSWSQAFHIPGSTSSTPTVSNTQVLLHSGSESDAYLNVSGTLGSVTNSTEQYGDFGANTGLDVRHHLMPSAKQMWQASADAEGGTSDLNNAAHANEYCNQHMGVYADNVVIPASVAEKVQGYKLFYAKSNAAEKRVKAYAPAWSWSPYSNLISADGNIGNNLDHQLLRIYDPYLLSTKPNGDNWEVKEIYKGMSYNEQLSYTMQDASVTTFGYMPNNTFNDDFDNENREPVLGLKLTERTGYDEGWDTVWPGYSPGTTVNYATFTNSVGTNQIYGWNTQIKSDTINYNYPTQSATDNAFGDNFASKFGGIQKRFGSVGVFTMAGQPDKGLASYRAVRERGTSNWFDPVGPSATTQPGSNAYHGFGAAGSFVCVWEDHNTYYENYQEQELVETHDLVKVTAAGTYKSNQGVFGGDTFITPVVVEFMNLGSGIDPTPIDVNDNNLFDRMAKNSYFTWSRVLPEHNDMSQTANWEDLHLYSEPNANFFNGEFLNDYSFGDHAYKSNDWKAAFTFRSDTLEANKFPNRIIRSSKQNYEGTQFAWSSFAAADYYDNALGKESIRNLEDYQGDLIIHHANAIFKTRSKFNFDATGMSVFVGTGDIFQAPPQELFMDAAGYAGVQHWSDTLLCRPGYVWIDRAGKRVFMLGKGLEELSAKGMRDYFRDGFCDIPEDGFVTSTTGVPTIHSAGRGGFTIGFDPVYDRLMFTKKFCSQFQSLGAGAYISTTSDGETISYSLRNQCWASMHDFQPYQYFQSYNKLFAWNELQWQGIVTAAKEENQAWIYEMNGANPGVTPVGQGNMASYVDIVFNMGGEKAKVWQNFNWVTRVGEGEGDDDRTKTFDEATVLNDHQISGTAGVSSFRRSDNRWNFNEFRDIATGTGTFFETITYAQDQFDSTRRDNTKVWYEQGRFISPYAVIRLNTLNSDGDKLYLTDVNATARLAKR